MRAAYILAAREAGVNSEELLRARGICGPDGAFTMEAYLEWEGIRGHCDLCELRVLCQRKAKSPAEADLLFGLAFETVRVRMPPDRQDSWFALMEEHGMVLNRPSEAKMQEMIDRVESEL